MRKVVIFAAGSRKSKPGEELMPLQPLGGRRVVDYVVDNALAFVKPEDLYVIVGKKGKELKARLKEGTNTIEQAEQLGTGHAMEMVRQQLGDFAGDLMVLYGDTPLIRTVSIQGMLNRHELRKTQITLMVAHGDRALPYGRIIRGDSGSIEKIRETSDAGEEDESILELNAGAYVLDARHLFEFLGRKKPEKPYARITDCFNEMIRAGTQVDSYCLIDPSEIQGIDTETDLVRAEFALQERAFRPTRAEEHNQIHFGTGGWRAIIGEGFTLHNVRRVAQALANDLIRRQDRAAEVLIGFDRRFLSGQAAEAAAEVFAGNNIQVVLLAEDAPTPLVTFATARQGASYGLVFTASHNPPEWNGLKVFMSDGALLTDDRTLPIEKEVNELTLADVIKADLDLAKEAGKVVSADFTNSYVDAVESLVDMQAIREAGLKVIVDPMHGVGHLTLGFILAEARCRVTFIHERRNPLFGGRSPSPDNEALQLLGTYLREGKFDLGLATDGDADRIAMLDEGGNYIPVNDLLSMLYWYLHEIRGQKGGVVRNVATTHRLDLLAEKFSETCQEVPVGFKHVSRAMKETGALMGGESSGGLTIRGHIQGKDGIFAAALLTEMLARTKKSASELRREVLGLVDPLVMEEENLPATPGMRVLVLNRLESSRPERLGNARVRDVSTLDGTRFTMEDGSWTLLRFSGTEPVLRLVAEAESFRKARSLIAALRTLVLEG
jgi:phosphomannomutase/molybdopterin-guanine dinucleotide biosynthesis protein A